MIRAKITTFYCSGQLRTQCSTGLERNSLSEMPSPPISNMRFGLNVAAKVSMPGSVIWRRPLFTSMAVMTRSSLLLQITLHRVEQLLVL